MKTKTRSRKTRSRKARNRDVAKTEETWKKRLIVEIDDIAHSINSIKEQLRNYYTENISNIQKEAFYDVVDRAAYVWGYDFHHGSMGYFPTSTTIGRRDIIPEDLALDSWEFTIPSGGAKHSMINAIINISAFSIFYGLKFRLIDGNISDIKGFKYTLSGVELPIISAPTSWEKKSDYYVLCHPVPAALSPTSTVELSIFCRKKHPALRCEVCISGEIIGKQPYLIKDPDSLVVENRSRSRPKE